MNRRTFAKSLGLSIAAIVSPVLTSGQETEKKQAEPQSWQRYKVDGEKFSVMLPTVPAMTTTSRFVQLFKPGRTERMIGAYADGVVYSIHTLQNTTPPQSLENFFAEQNRRDRWDVTTERAVTVSGIVGKEYSPRNKDLPATVQFFSVGGRLYEFTASGAPAEDPGVRQFFSSIVLGKKIEGTNVSDGPGRPFEPDTIEPVFSGKEVDRKCLLAMKPEPAYTERARQESVTGTVVLKAVFSATGSVVNIRVISALPHGLTDQAIKAARKIKFLPALKDGKRVAMDLQLEYNFNLY